MSLVDNDYINSLERGYCDSDKKLCHECIGNKSLKEYIKANGTVSTCDYCGQKRKAVNLDSFMPIIMSGVNFLYSRAVEELPCDSGEYVGKTYSTEQLIFEELYDEIDAQDERILADIVDIMYDDIWCDSDPFSDREEDTAYYDWQSFCKMVKEKVRYVFFRAEPDSSFSENPVNILDTLANYAERVKLDRKIDKNTKMYRCRTHKNDDWLTEYTAFAPPPPEIATSGRMNATGINVLYLTLDPDTALCETSVNGRDYATIASFRVKESIRVLDLTKIKTITIPSIFDEDNRHNRSPIVFLQKFAESISQPRNNKNIDIEYVPTQIVTEFFRYVKTNRSNGYAGILYDSTQNPGGKCLALFLNRDEVLNHKFGIHILPKATMYYKKEYIPIANDSTRRAKAEIFIDSISDKKIDELEKEATLSREAINNIIGKLETK